MTTEDLFEVCKFSKVARDAYFEVLRLAVATRQQLSDLAEISVGAGPDVLAENKVKMDTILASYCSGRDEILLRVGGNAVQIGREISIDTFCCAG